MRKIIVAITFALILVTGTMASAVDVQVNGTHIVFDESAQIIDGRTIVPMRAIFEVLGAEVYWNNETQEITAKRDKTSMTLKVNSKIMFLDDTQIELDIAPVIINDRTFVPVRVISETLNCDVKWDEENEIVNITDSSGLANPAAAKRYGENNVDILFSTPICQWDRDYKAYYADLDFDGKNEVIEYSSDVHPAIQPALELNFALNRQRVYSFLGTQHAGLYAGYIIDLDKNDNSRELLTFYGSEESEAFTIMRYENKNAVFFIEKFIYSDRVYEYTDIWYDDIDYSDRLAYIECYGDGWLTFTFDSGAQVNFKEFKRGYIKQIKN